MAITIRPVTEADAAAIAAIYAHHVVHGTASYEFEPPSVEETIEKIRSIGERDWPFIVAEAEGEVSGYAYATQFRDRPGYRFACEDSIYVAANKTGQGIGKALLDALIEHSAASGFRTMIAVVGGAEPASVGVHQSCGFIEVGRLKAVGCKFGRWLDNVYLQRDLRGN